MRKKYFGFEFFVIFAVFFIISMTFNNLVFADISCGVASDGTALGVDRGACCAVEDPNEPCCLWENDCDASNCMCNDGLPCEISGEEGWFYRTCLDSTTECGSLGEFCCLGLNVDRCDDGLNCEYDYERDDEFCYYDDSDCGHLGEPCCDGNSCLSGQGECLNVYHLELDEDYLCLNPDDYITNCSESGDVCCYDWGSDFNMCKTTYPGGYALSPSWESCYCSNGLETSVSGSTCSCMGEDECGIEEGGPCCNSPDPLQAPYCVGQGLACNLGPNTCCKDNDGNGECDFDCGGDGDLCCLKEGGNAFLEEDYYCESDSLDCYNGYCYLKDAPAPSSGKTKNMIYSGPIIDDLGKLFGPLTKILYYGGLFIGISFIVYSGYKLMISQGNPKETQDAQEQLTAAILGILFILLSAAILRIIITSIFGGSIEI